MMKKKRIIYAARIREANPPSLLAATAYWVTKENNRNMWEGRTVKLVEQLHLKQQWKRMCEGGSVKEWEAEVEKAIEKEERESLQDKLRNPDSKLRTYAKIKKESGMEQQSHYQDETGES